MMEQQLEQIFKNPALAIILMLWLLFWKGYSLWKAASKRQLVWFIILLMINTMGLLEIAYIFYLNRWDLDKGKLLASLEKKFAKKSS